jgi:hypothetical protein
MACAVEWEFEGSVLLCTQYDRRNVSRNARETTLL